MANKYQANFTKPPNMTPKWNGNDSLGTKIETMFKRFVESVIAWGYEFFAELAVDIFDASMKIMRPGLARVTDPMITELLSQPDLPNWYKTVLTNAMNEKGESAWYIKIAVFYAGVSGMIFGGLAPIRRLAEFNADKEARSYLPSVQELATLHHIGLISDTGFTENMKRLGVADPLIPVYQEYVSNLPSLGELFNGLWRKVYSDGEFTAQLKRMGYKPRDIELYKELVKNIPPIQDIIRFLVRDAFNDGASSRYGYDEDYPSEIDQFFEKQGYDKDWSKRYWRAHWNLPSPNQVYEMLHRGLIDKGTMEELLRISDYPKFWREKLIDISFNPITRVDLRRLYQAGLIPEDRLLKGYRDLGYPEADAQALAEFAKIGASNDEKDLTRNDIIDLYEDDLLDRNQTKGALIKLGYDEQESEYLLDKADFAIAKSERNDTINYAKERYLAKIIDKTRVITDLTSAGLSQTQIERYLLQWERSIEVKIVVASKADITKFYIAGYIDEAEYRNRLREMGYGDRDVGLYVQSANATKLQNEATEI